MKIKLLKTIVPNQKGKGKNKRYYPVNAEGVITNNGFRLSPFDLPNDTEESGRPLGGWIYEDLTTRELKQLEEGEDYILID